MKTTDFETSKKLKELGFEYLTDFYFDEYGQLQIGTCFLSTEKEKQIALAYDLETILDALPELHLDNQKYSKWLCFCDRENNREFFESKKEEESFANAAGRFLIRLHDKGIINFNEGK